MAHMSERVEKIAITPACEVRMLNRKGENLHEIEKSAGASQVFTQALIWAVTHVSEQEFPFIVDTPLARLSRDQRLGVLKTFTDRRGADLLTRDGEEAGSLGVFVTRLADLAKLAEGDSSRSSHFGNSDGPAMLTAALVLPVGAIAEDSQSGEPVAFPLNAPGGSPHMAIMGGTNSGKTYTALTMLKRLRSYGAVPILAFDFKGDLSEQLAPAFSAEVVSPPRTPVPLHVLAIQVSDETGTGASLAGLAVGEALCRIRIEAKTRRIVAWRP